MSRPKGPPLRLTLASRQDCVLTGLVTIRRATSGKPVLTIDVYCPYCHATHRHGWTEFAKPYWSISHRVAHCLDGSPLLATGYYIGLGISDTDREHNRTMFAKYTEQIARWNAKHAVATPTNGES